MKVFDPLNPPSQNQLAQHEEIAMKYVHSIATLLERLKPKNEIDLSPMQNSQFQSENIGILSHKKYYSAMAWAGLLNTNGWQTFEENYPESAEKYKKIIAAEEYGWPVAPSKEKCN